MWVGAWFSYSVLIIFLAAVTQYLTKATQGRKGSFSSQLEGTQSSMVGKARRPECETAVTGQSPSRKDEVNAGARFSFFFFSFWLCIRLKIQAGGMVLATLRVGLPSAETPGNVLRHMHSIMSWWTGKPATVKLTMTMNCHSENQFLSGPSFLA